MTTATAAPSFTLTRKGEEFTFSTNHSIESAVASLRGSYNTFAQDLVSAYVSNRLSRAQASWLLFLGEEASPTIAKSEAPAGEFSRLVDVVNGMQSAASDSAVGVHRH
jgi:hypothetical protein